MIGIPNTRRYYLYDKAADMRKSFAGLCGLVQNEMGQELLTGDGFIFINKRRTMIKILMWDRSGFVIYYKQLSSGTIQRPKSGDSHVNITTLLLMLEGVELEGVRMRKRYRREQKRA
jgi:transposase